MSIIFVTKAVYYFAEQFQSLLVQPILVAKHFITSVWHHWPTSITYSFSVDI